MGTLTLSYSGASLHLDTHQGMSAYQSYLSTTDDDPPLSEAEWAAPHGGGIMDGIVLSDAVGLIHYTGKAPSGSGTDDPVWDIRKTVFAADGTVSSSTTASGVAWDDRTTLDYD